MSPCVSQRQAVVAINTRTGAVLWTVLLGVMPHAYQGSRAFQPFSALVTGPRGRRVVLVGRTGVRVLDLTTRTLSAWTPLPGMCPAVATDDQSGHIVFTSGAWDVNNGHLCAAVSVLDTRTGRLMHSLTMADPVQAGIGRINY